MQRVNLVFVALALALVPATSSAKVVKFRDGNVQIDVDKKLKATKAKGSLTLATRDNLLIISLTAVPTGDVSFAYKELRKQIEKTLSNTTDLAGKKGVVNGLDGLVRSAKGELNGTKMDALAMVLKTGPNKVIMVFALGATGMYEEKYGDAFNKALKSIKKIGAR